MTPEYYQQNKEKLKGQIKEYYLKHREERLQYQRDYRKKNRLKLTERDRNKRNNRLTKAVEFLGGKCNRCQETYDPCVYDFHHLNPQDKDFTIGENMLIGEIRFFAEVQKCMLLCANCHRLIHKELDAK